MLQIIPDGFARAFRADGVRRAAALLAALCALASAPAVAAQAGTAAEQEGPPRFRVVIEAPEALRRLLEEGLNLLRWQRDELMTPELLAPLVAEARAAAEQAAAAEGYFSAVVKAGIEQAEGLPLVRLTVEPGPRTVVGSVEITFRGAVLEDARGAERMSAVRRAWPLREGQPFRQADWDAAKQAAVTELANRVYAAAALASSEARVDPSTQRAALRIEIDSGPPFHIGAVEVEGTHRYPPSIVHAVNPLGPGEPYDAARLAAFQRRLLETGYFATAQITLVRDRARAAAAPVRVSVIEGQSQRVDAGILASTDTRLGAQLNYGNQDFLDRALRLRSNARVDRRQTIVDTSIDTPPRAGEVWNTVSARYEQTDIQNQRSEGTVIGASHNWGAESAPSRIAVSWNRERQVIAGSTTERNDAVFVAYQQVFRRTDDPLLPRRGVLGSFQIGRTVPALATRQFVRATGKLNVLVPLARRLDLAARTEGGIVFAESRADIPSWFLFRTGGDQTVRGYAFQSIGVPQGAAVVGGRYLLVGSLEAIYWFAGEWGAAAFVDAGDAFDDRDDFDPAVGYGLGVRWRSPVGPFRADVAYGERTGSLRLHFSVGFTF